MNLEHGGAVQLFPGEVVAINGTATGPWQPAPASTFRYNVEVVTGDGIRRVIQNVKPNKERWPEHINVNPIAIGTLVTVFIIGTKAILGDIELPHVESCAGGEAGSGDVAAMLLTVQRMTPRDKELFKALLNL